MIYDIATSDTITRKDQPKRTMEAHTLISLWWAPNWDMDWLIDRQTDRLYGNPSSTYNDT